MTLTVNIKLDDETVAELCHELNRTWCSMNGDTSHIAWWAAPRWQRDSAKAGVAFARANPDATPADQHEAWMKAKLDDGWVYGEEKDPHLKTHPCLVPYSELPFGQRFKDHLFRAVVQAAVAAEEKTHG